MVKWGMRLFFISLFLFSGLTWGKVTEFSGKIVKNHQDKGMVRISSWSENLKFFRSGHRLHFWRRGMKSSDCQAVVLKHFRRELLVAVDEYARCSKALLLSEGTSLIFMSDDLSQTLYESKDLIHLLLKKRSAQIYRQGEINQKLKTHPQKVLAVNERFRILKEKLEKEWQEELYALEQDRVQQVEQRENINLKIGQIERELEENRYIDPSLEQDFLQFYSKK